MKRLVRQAAEQGADWVLLPEYWPLMGRKDTDKLAFAEPLVGSNFSETRYARFGETRCARFQTTLSETAAECGVVLFGGTIPLESPDAGKVMNTDVGVRPRRARKSGCITKCTCSVSQAWVNAMPRRTPSARAVMCRN